MGFGTHPTLDSVDIGSYFVGSKFGRSVKLTSSEVKNDWNCVSAVCVCRNGGQRQLYVCSDRIPLCLAAVGIAWSLLGGRIGDVRIP
jgi:hypothetical protein